MSMEQQPEDRTLASEAPAAPSGASERSSVPLFFSSPELTQCADLLLHLTENTALIPLVKGGEGAGKTTLLFRLQSLAPETWSICRIDANPMLHPEQLLSRLAHHFGISEEDDQLKQHLIDHFNRLRHGGIFPVVAVDDAHLLPVATVATLLQLHESSEEGSPLLRVILFALPGIEGLLQAPEVQTINAGGIHTLDIPRLTQGQAGAYITHVLAARGALETLALTPGQFEKIYQTSKGLPGAIERLLTKSPSHPAAPQTAVGKPALKLLLEDLPTPILLGGFLLIAVIIMLLIFQDEINSLFEGETVQPHEEQIGETFPVQQELPLELPPKIPEQQPAETAAPPLLSRTKPEPAEEPEPIRAIPVETVQVALPKEAAGKEPSLPVPALNQIPPAPEKIEAKPAPESKAAPATPPEKPAEIEAPPPPAPKKAAVQAKPKPAPKKIKKSAEREKWLLSQKPTAYALQLIGLKDEPSIRVFIKRHRLHGKVAYFKTSRKGQPWFALLYGIYPNKEAALEARSKLPKSLRRRPDIWTRSIESVQKEIRAK